MANVFLVDLESVPSRYTCEWKTHLPSLLTHRGHNVQVISGPSNIPEATTPGAFLNFGGTNIYKSVQVEQISRLFCEGRICSGDHFLFTDAWHSGIINLKYMSQLLNVPVKIHALWHAGSYDPHDFLGRLIGDQPWVRHAEQSFFHAADHNYFATDFHIKIFADAFSETEDSEWLQTMIYNGKIVRSGWPMEYMNGLLSVYKGVQKRDLIVFPHRIAPEKQVEIFRDLKQSLPQFEFVVCQDQELTKTEYHNLLSEAKIVFSCSLQETLGIGCYEGTVLDAIPLVPDRLSYFGMYFDEFKYPSEWTLDWQSYQKNKQDLCALIERFMLNYEKCLPLVRKQEEFLTSKFFNSNVLLDFISNKAINET